MLIAGSPKLGRELLIARPRSRCRPDFLSIRYRSLQKPNIYHLHLAARLERVARILDSDWGRKEEC